MAGPFRLVVTLILLTAIVTTLSEAKRSGGGGRGGGGGGGGHKHGGGRGKMTLDRGSRHKHRGGRRHDNSLEQGNDGKFGGTPGDTGKNGARRKEDAGPPMKKDKEDSDNFRHRYRGDRRHDNSMEQGSDGKLAKTPGGTGKDGAEKREDAGTRVEKEDSNSHHRHRGGRRRQRNRSTSTSSPLSTTTLGPVAPPEHSLETAAPTSKLP